MVKRDILGSEIWECNESEAKKIWYSQPENRWRLWSSDEVTAHMLDTPQQIAECIRLKTAKPGKL